MHSSLFTNKRGEIQESWDSFDGISLPIIRDFAELWHSLRGGRPVPSRRDFEPTEAKIFLPHLFLLDVVRPEMRFRGRLVGTMIVQSIGFDYTGKYLDEVISEPYNTQLHADLAEVAETGVLHYRIKKMEWNDRSFNTYHRLYLPMTVDTERIEIVVGIACLVDRNDNSVGQEPVAASIVKETSRVIRIDLPDPS